MNTMALSEAFASVKLLSDPLSGQDCDFNPLGLKMNEKHTVALKKQHVYSLQI